MSGLYHDIESRIQDALHLIEPGTEPNISELARQFTVPRGRLYARYHGRLSKSDYLGFNRCLSDQEEVALCRYLDRLDCMGLPAQRELLRAAADYILD
jgi:predicted N-acyltransferase